MTTTIKKFTLFRKPRWKNNSDISLSRGLFYGGYYLFSIIYGGDLSLIILTFPIFLAIFLSLLYTDSSNLGYIDAIAVIYFLSFVITPLQNVENFSFPYSDISRGFPYSKYHFFIVAALALFSYLCLFFLLKGRNIKFDNKVYYFYANPIYIIAISLFFCSLAIVGAGSLGNLLASRFEKEASEASFVLPICIATLSINAVFSIINLGSMGMLKKVSIWISILSLLVVVNPFNTPRFFLLGAWIPVIATAFPAALKPKYFYSAIPIVVLIVLPVLSITTRFSDNNYDMIRTILYDTKSIFRISYFGLFEAGLEAIRYTDMRGHEYGGVFTSTVLTFFPRSWWPDKPINSGLLIGYMNFDEGLRNTNLAIPWFMDGFIDFGIIGSVIYSILFAFLFSYLRSKFEKNIYGKNIYFYLFISNIAILLRGTLAVTCILFLFQIIFLSVYSKLFVRSLPLTAQRRGAR